MSLFRILKSTGLLRWRTEWRKHTGREHSTLEVDPRWRERERHFRSPPMTQELVHAIARISPQFHLRPTETSRSFWELTQNGSCWGEYDALAPLLTRMQPPAKVLEVGCGLGRSAVFFKKALPWRDSAFHLYDADGPRIHYPRTGERTGRTFCGDLQALREVLAHNEIEHVQIFDARELDNRLEGLPGPYDLIYSFYAAGFHWSLADFWDELEALIHDNSIGIFTIHRNFETFPQLSQVASRIVTFERSLIKDHPHRMLVISRNEDLLRALD